jgi:hypothetical protein
VLVSPAAAREKVVRMTLGPFRIEANRDREVCQAVRVPGVPGIGGTFPDDSPLTRVAPVPIRLKNGGAKRFAYKSPAAPNGTITNGGGVEILDPEGKRLAVTGSQAKP